MPSVSGRPRGLGTPRAALAPALTPQLPPGLWRRAPSETLVAAQGRLPLPLRLPGFASCRSVMTHRSAARPGCLDAVFCPPLSLPRSLCSLERTKARAPPTPPPARALSCSLFACLLLATYWGGIRGASPGSPLASAFAQRNAGCCAPSSLSPRVLCVSEPGPRDLRRLYLT